MHNFLNTQVLVFSLVFLNLFSPGFILAGSNCCESVGIEKIGKVYDDLAWSGFSEAAVRNLAYLQRQQSSRVYRLCEREYKAEELAGIVKEFIDLTERGLDGAEFEKIFRERFDVCAAKNSAGAGEILVTGYFEPMLEGSLRKEPPFIYPLYAKPDDLITQDGKVGRIEDGRLLPYWTRAEIENNGVLAGNELVFLDDPVEAFILHVQGSGKIRLRDGRIRRIQFAAKNGLPYRSIGRLLVDQGAMNLASVSLPAIVDYLKEHPFERKSVLQYNQSFIFFRWRDDSGAGPLGSLGFPLTAGRSVALDQQCFPPGLLGFLSARKPIFNGANEIIGWMPLRRFVFNQDSGSAIKGGGRVDLFLGAGERARKTAGIMKHPGRLYFLVGKK